MKQALAQFNPRVGDVPANTQKILSFIEQARQRRAEVVIFPELALVGYPPRDLLDYPQIADACEKSLKEIAKASTEIAIVCGFVEKNPAAFGKPYFNSLAFIAEGKVQHLYRKQLLPYYDVFEDERYFEPGKDSSLFEWKGKRIGFAICEDIWGAPPSPNRLYASDPIEALAKLKPDLVICIAASPFHLGKPDLREKVVARVAQKTKSPVTHVNQVGANDEIIFDGSSLWVDAQGKTLLRAKAFQEDLVFTDSPHLSASPSSEGQWLKDALVLGIRDYVTKCKASKVILGLSGGIDSSVVAALAVEALGKDKVFGVSLPTRYTSQGSLSDTKTLATRLEIGFREIPIEPSLTGFEKMLGDLAQGVVLENIQPRIRMTVLMALANRDGSLLLNTSNKSEIACGYATLYGDSAGALAVLGDLTKNQVYTVGHSLNEKREIIPRSVFEKAPSAELRPDQTDQDTLPPYPVLDQLVEETVVQGRTSFSEATPEQLATFRRLHGGSEYKRRQLPPVLRVSARAFGMGRRIPVASRHYVDI